MRKILTTIALTVTSLVTFAQQDAQFSMNMFNKLSVNPGYAGTSQALCGVLFYRQQWTSFPGAPKTGLLSVDFGPVLRGGVGLTVDQDQLGFDKTLKAKLAYSYHLHIGTGVLGIGLDAGMIQKSIKGDFVAPDGTSTSAGDGIDSAIPWGGTAATTYDVGFGLYYTTSRLYVGLSSLHLPQQNLKKTHTADQNPAFDFDYKVARHYYVMAGYKFPINNQLSITPSVLAKSDASSTQLDLNLLAKWNNLIFGGVSYRLTDAIVAIVGLERDINPKTTARFGYSYDITTSAIKNHSNGTHEIMLGFCYKLIKPVRPTSHMNVRFL